MVVSSLTNSKDDDEGEGEETLSSLLMSCFEPPSSSSSSLSTTTTSIAMVAVALVVAVVILYHLHQLYKLYKRRKQLKQWINERRYERSLKSRQCNEVLSRYQPDDVNHNHDTITATEIINGIKSGQIDILQNIINTAYRCRRYGYSDRYCIADNNRNNNLEVNAITQELYDDAYEQGKQLLVLKEDFANKVLYGLPISIKDQYSLKGQLQTGGLACRLKSPATQDSSLITKLKQHGAIPICMSNTIQLMMMPETYNNIYGRTCNPYNLERVVGGSSGGDAALVSMGCVSMGIGGDVAGSIRIPASCCGIIGFKPTSTRIASVGGDMKPRLNNRAGTTLIIPSTPACFTKCINDAVLFMISQTTTYDSDNSNKDNDQQQQQQPPINLNIPSIPFNTRMYEQTHCKKLTIGYFETDDWYQPCTAALRGLRETIIKLKKEGHTCINLTHKIPTNGWFNYGL